MKPPLVPSKPPIAPSSQIREINKDPIMKVKVEKNIQPKVYDSQKNIKPQGIIKSGGFSAHV